jgi:hypothetical protein
MTNPARAAVETALRARKLDRTLTTAFPLHPAEGSMAPTAIPGLDAVLGGGLPRGELSELAGRRSAGATTLSLQLLAAATARGEIAALIDASDRLDVAVACAAGIDPARLLWVRGQSTERAHGSGTRDLLERALARALKAVSLVLQAGGFGVVVLDVADIPAAALTRLPFTTWMRLQRALAGSDTAGVLVVPEPLARSAGGVTIALTAQPAWAGTAAHARLDRLDVCARVISPRRRLEGDTHFRAESRDAIPCMA